MLSANMLCWKDFHTLQTLRLHVIVCDCESMIAFARLYERLFCISVRAESTKNTGTEYLYMFMQHSYG